MDRIALLYRNYDVLANAKDKIGEHEKEYTEILDAVKGATSEKRLASQFIARFFKEFPHLAEKAIDAQLDLCEDADVAIRKQAIKDLPSFCKSSQEYVPKIADVLAQLLLTEDSSELLVIYHSLATLIKLDAKGTLGGIFSQVMAGEDLVRERAIKFLCTKLPSMSSEVFTKEVEEFLFQECCKVMQDVTGQEFSNLMSLLSGLKLAKKIPGQQALVDLAAEQAELDKPLERSANGSSRVPDSTATEAVAKLVHCIRQVLPFFSPYVSSARFVRYLCQQVVPVLSEMPSDEEGLELIKLLAEMAPHANGIQEHPSCLELVFNKLLEYMPLPPTTKEAENLDEAPALQLTHVECLVYAFHQLAKRNPEFLTADGNSERLRDFKLRLQYLARGVQGYIKKLRTALQAKKPEDIKSNQLKAAALKTTSNINVLIRDLFHVPPAFKATITLSWKPAATNKGSELAQAPTAMSFETGSSTKTERRRISFSEESPPKVLKKGSASSRTERELYSPPGGKYSTKVQGFQAPSRGGRGRFRGGGGRGWRGRINT